LFASNLTRTNGVITDEIILIMKAFAGKKRVFAVKTRRTLLMTKEFTGRTKEILSGARHF